MKYYYEVVIAKEVMHLLTYHNNEKLFVGQIVIVQVLSSFYVGFINKSIDAPSFTTKEIHMIIPLHIPPVIIKFIHHCEDITMYPLGYYLSNVISSIRMRMIKNKLDTYKPLPYTPLDIIKIPILSPEQNISYKEMNQHTHRILYGVTGSGKTEMIIKLIIEKIQNNKQINILILVPEIGLQYIWEQRLTSYIKGHIIKWHSSTNLKERKWMELYFNTTSSIVIGTRCAIFLPVIFDIIIIDEEHDTSYNQDFIPTYHLNDLIIHRGAKEIVWVSATPLVNTYFKYPIISLTSKYYNKENSIIQYEDSKQTPLLSTNVMDKIQFYVKNKKQILILVNRRGYNSITFCKDCKTKILCKNCDISLILHSKENIMKCHGCGQSYNLPYFCRKCKTDGNITYIGYGIERILKKVKEKLGEEYRILTLSSDICNSEKKFQNAMEKIKNQEIDIIISTQIFAKGHDFPHLLMGYIIDIGGSSKSYNSLEQYVQKSIQVMGRIGRREQGLVIIRQEIDNVPQLISYGQDYKIFLHKELNNRKIYNLPPIGTMKTLIFKSKSKNTIIKYGEKIYDILKINNIECMYPMESSPFMVNNYYHIEIIITKIPENSQTLKLIVKKYTGSILLL